MSFPEIMHANGAKLSSDFANPEQKGLSIIKELTKEGDDTCSRQQEVFRKLVI